MSPNTNQFVGSLSKNEYCLRDTMTARSFHENNDLQSWLDGKDVQDLSRRIYEEVEEGASTDEGAEA